MLRDASAAHSADAQNTAPSTGARAYFRQLSLTVLSVSCSHQVLTTTPLRSVARSRPKNVLRLLLLGVERVELQLLREHLSDLGERGAL